MPRLNRISKVAALSRTRLGADIQPGSEVGPPIVAGIAQGDGSDTTNPWIGLKLVDCLVTNPFKKMPMNKLIEPRLPAT